MLIEKRDCGLDKISRYWVSIDCSLKSSSTVVISLNKL